MGKNLYIKIWEDERPNILDFLRGDEKNVDISLNSSRFSSVGNRENSGYTFRLEIINGVVPLKSGSAVARDLKQVLDSSKEFKMLAKDYYLLIRLDKEFYLHISKKYNYGYKI